MKKLDANVDSSSENFVIYNHECPDPVFSAQDIDYIETINKYFSSDELLTIRNFERFIYNKTTKQVAFHEIPGLRPSKTNSCIWFSRFSNENYSDIIDKFFHLSLTKLPDSMKYTAMIPGYKLHTPDGNTFYPIVYWGDISLRKNIFKESARFLRSKLAEFRDGKFFYLDDSAIFAFSALTLEKLEKRRPPKGW